MKLQEQQAPIYELQNQLVSVNTNRDKIDDVFCLLSNIILFHCILKFQFPISLATNTAVVPPSYL